LQHNVLVKDKKIKERQTAGVARIRTCIHVLLHVFNQTK
jgi:hypothetical protein